MKAKKLAEELLDGEKHTMRSMIGDGGALLDRLFEIRHIDEVSQLVKKAVEPRDKPPCADPVADDVRDINSRNKPRVASAGRGENGEAHRRSLTGKAQSRENPGRKVSFKIRGGSSPYKGTPAASFRRGRTLLSDGKMGGVRSNNVAKLASKFNSLVLDGGDKERADHPPSVPKCEEPPSPKNKLVDSEVTLRHADTKERPRKSISRHSSLLKIQHIGNVKATIRIFEESAKSVVDVEPCKKAITAQEHPKYCKVVFKNSGKLVMVDCGDIDGPKYSAPTSVSSTEPSTNNKPPYYEANAKCAQLDTLETANESDVCVAMTEPSIKRGKMSPGAHTVGEQGAPPDPAFEKVQTSRDATKHVGTGQRESVDFLQKAPMPARLDVLGEKEDEDLSTYAVKPNSSFLWGRPSVDVVAAPDQTYQAVRVLIVGRHDANDYDDVCPPSDDAPLVDEAAYDDVGAYSEKQHEAVGNPAPAQDKHSYEYCDPALSYDDCEGEGYEFVGDGQEPSNEANIYDDVKCVSDPRVVSDDVTSISNCYESIYSLGTGDDRRVLKTTPPSSLAGSFCDKSNSLYGVTGSRFDSASLSQASTLSADYAPHSMSLERPGPGSEASDEWMDMDASHSEGETEAVKAAQERFRARRSPKWSRKVRRQRCKSGRRLAGPTGCVFVSSSSVLYLGELRNGTEPREVLSNRAQNLATLRAVVYVGETQESQEMTFFIEQEGGETSTESEPDHHYEMLYEVVGGQNNHKHIIEEDDFDSFDSDDSAGTYRKPGAQENFDVTTRLPDLPSGQNIYGITKIAEAAGKKMLKFRKSLSRMRTKRNSTDLGILTVARTPSPPPVPAALPPLPMAPPPPVPSVPSPALSTPPPLPSAPPPVRSAARLPPPTPMEKAASSTSLVRRKYWSLRRFKRSLSSVSQYPSALPHQGAKETATFYLTPAVDADTSPSSQERRTSTACSETSDVPSSQSSCGSTNTLVYESRLEDRVTAKKRPPIERPHSPPPLPPTTPSEIPKRVPRRREKKTGNSSWYAECGLFDQAELANLNNTDGQRRGSAKSDKPNSYSLYAEVGLWDATAYNHDTSQSSCGSDNTYGYDNKNYVETRFADEPLYQFYTAAVAEQVQGHTRDDTDSDGYEEICDVNSQISAAPRPTAMELIRPREGKHRTLWCEIPEVLNSQVLGTINAHQRKLQEAKFEIITSEASYANSLNMLEKHFISSRELHDESILSKNDRRTLFSNVLPVRNCSAKFLTDLEVCWQDSIMLHGICNIIYEHATSHFGVYVKYCSNQIYLDRTLRRLKGQHGKFADALSELEASSVCQSLSLHSFLMLPMQRITRLPLLVDAVLTRLDPEDEEYSTCKLALATLNKIVQECNEGARRMERMEEILILNRQLEFSREVKAVPIISSSRWLIKKGELTHIIWRGDEGKLTFGKKFSKVAVHLFLFTDMLIITKKKSEDSYLVIDYCPRNLIHIAVADEVPHLPVKFTSDNSKHLMLLTMLQNHEKKTVEMVLSCPLESDRQRWLEAVNPPVSVNPGETVYSEWDCPQVTAIHSYVANQPDELSLNVTDVVNVLRKMPDGWYQGERIRDGETGWFPGNYTVEVGSAHVRARNLKQRYRLLALSGNYLSMQTKEKSGK